MNGNRQEQVLADRANSVIQKIPKSQQGFFMRDIVLNPKIAAEKYDISENDAYMLAGYYRQFGR